MSQRLKTRSLYRLYCPQNAINLSIKNIVARMCRHVKSWRKIPHISLKHWLGSLFSHMNKSQGIHHSVWPDCLFNIWPFIAMKKCPAASKIYQRKIKTFLKNSKTLKFVSNSQFFSKVAKFCQIWSRCLHSKDANNAHNILYGPS